MPRTGYSRAYMQIHKVHIADGFADDCEELIHRWLKTETLTYETFCAIWKDMQFNLLYHGRGSGAEMAELSEELVHIAKHYMVSNTDNFEESVAGLFLVYGILHLQPYPDFACLRVVPEDVASIARLETVARREKRYDVLYILASVLIEGPVQYHAAARERGMESSLRKYLEGTTGIDRVGIRPKGVFYRQTEELDLLRELSSITKRYSEAKQALGGEYSRSLNYSNDKLPTELDSSLKEIINGITDDGDEANKKITEHYEKVQEIKRRAMKQTVDTVKHLASVENRAAPPRKSKAKRKSRKGKTAQGKSTPMMGYPGTTEMPLLDRRRAKSKQFVSSSSESETTMTSPDGSDSDNDSRESFTGLFKNNVNTHDKEGDLNVENVDKGTSLNLEKIDNEGENITKENIEIQIESLPVLIRSESNGQMVEIEVIDEMNQKIPNTEDAESEFAILPDVSVEELNTGQETASATVTEIIADNTETVEVPTSSEKMIWLKLAKRDQKKTILKSKFKSMGLLSIANFEENQNKSGSPRKSERIRYKSESKN